MQVIMLKDVGGVGKRGSMRNVSDGYALNYLIPRGLAEQATPAKVAAFNEQLKAEQKAIERREDEWEQIARRLREVVVTVTARANAIGHLYNQLTPDMIIAAIHEKLGISVPPDALAINMPIKSLGEWEVEFRKGAHAAKFKVVVQGAVK